MSTLKWITALTLLALLPVGLAGLALGHGTKHGQDHHQGGAGNTANAGSVNIKLLDLRLVDQDGTRVSFRRDMIADKIVVMDFVYTTCTTVCPILSAVMAEVQRRLGDRVGADVRLVSISVDPITDTPERLKAYARRVGARSGWTWLTGQKFTVDQVLDGLGAYTPNFEDHPAMVLVGDGRTGQWARFFGFPSPDQIMAKVDALVAARKAAVSAAEVEHP